MSDNNFMLPKIEQAIDDTMNHYSVFRIEPLEPGFGTTLGNAMRRVLLSSLPGAAITQIKINNIYHEFSDIPHVKEDTTELILNIKQIRIRLHQDRPARLLLEATGPGRITAADIICPPDVEIVNPDQYLATLDSPEGKLSIEFTVERGRGYASADAQEGLPIGVIPVDAIYTPIRRVNYHVENTRVGQQTNFDRLTLEVWTDGTVEPEEAVSQSAQILMRHLNLLAELGGRHAPELARPAAGAMPVPSSVAEMPIEELELSVRAYNCLKRSGITKVGKVLQMNEDDLLSVRNFGRKSLEELRDKLRQRGLLESSRLAPTGPSDLGGEMGEEEEEEEEEQPFVKEPSAANTELEEEEEEQPGVRDEDYAQSIFGVRAPASAAATRGEEAYDLEDEDLGEEEEEPLTSFLSDEEEEEEELQPATRGTRAASDFDEDEDEVDTGFNFDENEVDEEEELPRGRKAGGRKSTGGRRDRRTGFYVEEDNDDWGGRRGGRRR